MKKLIILLILVMAIPVVAQEKKAKKAEKPEQPKFEVKKFEILESQKLGLADMLARHQRELSERLNIILADLRIAYPDMPENVALNQQTWTFEARVPAKQEKDGTKD